MKGSESAIRDVPCVGFAGNTWLAETFAGEETDSSAEDAINGFDGFGVATGLAASVTDCETGASRGVTGLETGFSLVTTSAGATAEFAGTAG